MPVYLPSLGRSLNFAANACNQMCNAALADHGLTLAHWVILSALWREDGMPVSDLARYNGTNLPAASRVVDRMVDAGLVSRRPDPSDRRSVLVYLTPKGEGLRGLAGFHDRVNAALLAGFSDTEAAQLADMLARVAQNAQNARAARGGAEAQ